jgi:hypothetical protein
MPDAQVRLEMKCEYKIDRECAAKALSGKTALGAAAA